MENYGAPFGRRIKKHTAGASSTTPPPPPSANSFRSNQIITHKGAIIAPTQKRTVQSDCSFCVKMERSDKSPSQEGDLGGG